MKFSTGNFQSRAATFSIQKFFKRRRSSISEKSFGQRSPLAFPFFAFSLGGEKREKTYGSGNPCRIAVLRQARQAERQQAPTLLSPSGRVARSTERGQPRNIKSCLYITLLFLPPRLRSRRFFRKFFRIFQKAPLNYLKKPKKNAIMNTYKITA